MSLSLFVILQATCMIGFVGAVMTLEALMLPRFALGMMFLIAFFLFYFHRLLEGSPSKFLLLPTFAATFGFTIGIGLLQFGVRSSEFHWESDNNILTLVAGFLISSGILSALYVRKHWPN